MNNEYSENSIHSFNPGPEPRDGDTGKPERVKTGAGASAASEHRCHECSGHTRDRGDGAADAVTAHATGAPETAGLRARLNSLASGIVSTTLEQVYIRKQDGLLILRPNRMYFVNRTARDILERLYSPRYHSKAPEGAVEAPSRGRSPEDGPVHAVSAGRSPENGGNTTASNDEAGCAALFVDAVRACADSAAKFRTDAERVMADAEKLLTTLSSLLSSQASVPYVDLHPTPALRMTGFGSHSLYYPVLSEIALTYRCQLSCKFCYAGSPKTRNAKCAEGEMSLDEIRRVIDRIHGEAHCPTISFTGGEPTLRETELTGAIRYAKSLGMRTNLITNGMLLSDPAYCLRLADAGLDSAQVSLEGPDATTHDAMTGLAGSFEKSVAAVKKLAGTGIHTHTNTTLTSENYRRAGDLPRFLAGLGLEYFSVNMIIKTGCANENEGLLIDYTTIGPVITALSNEARAAGIRLVWYSPTPYCLFNPVEAGLGSKSCAAAAGLLSVSPSGEVLPCSSFSGSLGNILKNDFDKIWSSRAARYFREKKFIPPACSGCNMRDICQGGCPLYWDARGDFEEIERAAGRRGGIRNAAHRLRRFLTAPKYGI